VFPAKIHFFVYSARNLHVLARTKMIIFKISNSLSAMMMMMMMMMMMDVNAAQ
jgi:hypothetical protein